MPSHAILDLLQAQNAFTRDLARAAGPNLSPSQSAQVRSTAHAVMMSVLKAEQQRVFGEVARLARTAGPSVAGEGGVLGPKLPARPKFTGGPKLPPRPKFTGRVFSM